MLDKEKPIHRRASVHFSAETMRQATELEQMFGESRSKVISRAIEILYTMRINALRHTPE